MTIIKLITSFKQFSHRYFAKGQFGEVSCLEYKEKSYALKSIIIKPDSE